MSKDWGTILIGTVLGFTGFAAAYTFLQKRGNSSPNKSVVNTRNLVIYSIFVRNHSQNGKFEDVTRDLPRIRSMGVDIIWLMPIHPIGQLKKKGTLGSPYSVSDYTKVNPEYGTKEDFKRLIDVAHAIGLKVMIDVVYNHTSHDSVYIQEHPEWYHLDENGNPYASVPKWTDIIDLDFSKTELWSALISALCGWVGMGVDGFRCDVAWMIPMEFWKEARLQTEKLNPNLIWLCETFGPHVVEYRRNQGKLANTDNQVLQVFDIAYDYDYWLLFEKVMQGKEDVKSYLNLLRYQDCIFPTGFSKLRFVENHDQSRVMTTCPTNSQAMAWTAFVAFNHGPFLMYSGQESSAKNKPDLFNKDPIEWGDRDLQHFLTKLSRLKKKTSGQFVIIADKPAVVAVWYDVLVEGGYYGIFNVHGDSGEVECPNLEDGVKVCEVTGEQVEIKKGYVSLPSEVFIIPFNGKRLQFIPLHSPLFNR